MAEKITEEKTFETGNEPTVKRQQSASTLSEADVARIAGQLRASMGGPAAADPVPAEELSKEDKAVVSALARVHPSARAVVVRDRVSVGTNLYHVEVSYTLATGAARQDAEYLVYDNGKGKVTVLKAD